MPQTIRQRQALRKWQAMNRIAYRKGYKYQLAKTYILNVGIHPVDPIYTDFISLGTDGILLIKSGYAWDGASGPAIDTKTILRGSLVHDALYQLIREGHLPKYAKVVADKVLHDLCIQDGMAKVRAWYVHQAVLKFGDIANVPRETLYAP